MLGAGRAPSGASRVDDRFAFARILPTRNFRLFQHNPPNAAVRDEAEPIH
jgi:hypothetical protein